MPHIEPVQPADWTIAMEFALACVSPDERPNRIQHCLNLIKNGVLDARGVFVARVGETIVGAQVCVPLHGAACLFWLPASVDACADALVRAALDWCKSLGCKLAQSLAKQDELPRTAPLTRNGFRRITRLQQWGRDLLLLPPMPPVKLQVKPYRPALAGEFAATLERTYEGTLDCPELNDVRSIDEIIEGHRSQGRFHPEYWWLAYVDDRPAGVLLLVEMLEDATWELAYLGMVPEFRSRGLGRSLLIQAMHALSESAATHLLLAVDERNRPAIRLYRSLGFVEIESSEVFLITF